MQILPLEHPEPFAATLGIMLYPGLEASEQSKAKAFAAQYLASGPLRRAIEAGNEIPADVFQKVALDAGEPLDDIMKRWKAGQWIGDLIAVWAILSVNHAKYASWSNVMKLAIDRAGSRKGTETDFKKYRRTHGSVGHLWAAWMFRGQKLSNRSRRDHGAFDDYESFLFESELLRTWGQNWRHSAANSPHPLPEETWRVPANWSPRRAEALCRKHGILQLPVFEEQELEGLAASG